ncbi:MAG TPA: thioesterase family protein [Mycobacteriales bacterium]|nr:thioesterase family protein [Mycobacteriales bacterium]
MTTEYDAATALEPTGDHSFATTVDPGWFVAGPNGGYLAATLLRAAQDIAETAGRPARSLTVHYPQPGAPGPATVDVEVSRVGRSLTFVAVRMRQDERLVAYALAALGTGRSDVTFQDVVPPATPSPEGLGPPKVPAELMPPIMARFDYRPTEDQPLFAGDRSEAWCWIRLVQQRPVDDAVLALMADALPPAMFFRKATPHVYPTVDLTVHFRHPVPPDHDGWCLAHVATRTASGGFIEEDCELYDRGGTLLAQSRQLAVMVPMG